MTARARAETASKFFFIVKSLISIDISATVFVSVIVNKHKAPLMMALILYLELFSMPHPYGRETIGGALK
ncbi:MAG: hypothetical protein RR850_11615 [Hafnia sp.]